jgi:phosphoribosylanthranilate isomerase
LFRVKICGVSSVEDALAAAEAGADAIGLNFYAPSKRYVEEQVAAEIVRALPAKIRKIGLFVNESPERIEGLRQRVGFDAVQLHGDEPASDIALLRGVPIVKAFRLAAGEGAKVEQYVAACAEQKAQLAAVLIDAYQTGSFGGTGQTADWLAAAELRERLAETRLILAGGLTHANVAAAVKAVQPFGVDTASGVESSPGKKDLALVRQFVSASREALGI